MRIPSLAIALAAAAASGACVENPDPRKPTITQMQRGGLGGWIVIQTPDGARVSGELIAVEPAAIRVLVRDRLLVVAPGNVVKADLYTYESESGFGAWGALGGLSTISHGFFAVLTFPIWAISSGVAAGAETRHVQLSYPGDDWPQLAAWARFPQGLPPDVGEAELFRARPPGAPSSVPPSPLPGLDPEHKRARAWELTKRAAAAARNGDCAQVRELDPLVAELDPDFRAVVFGRDAAIVRCLAATP